MDINYDEISIKEESLEEMATQNKPLERTVTKDEDSERIVFKDEPLEVMQYDETDDQTFRQISRLQEIQKIERVNSEFEIKTEIKIKEESLHFGVKPAEKSKNFKQIAGISEKNKVESLLKTPFRMLKLEEQLEIKRLGPYQPRDIVITQIDGKKRRTFSPTWFDKKSWLTASDERKSLFCFCCVLFGGEHLWAKTGCADLKHLSERIYKHECSTSHMSNYVSLQMFGKVNIPSKIVEGYRLNIKKHNEKVDKNRHCLNRIINCLKFCAFHELPIRGHDELEGSDNRGIFLDLVSFTADLDCALCDHLENKNVPKNTSKCIQNDLLQCMFEVYTEEITEEIKNTRFVSLQANETTNIAFKSRFVILLRYLKDFQPVERFLGFVELKDRTANRLTQVLKEILGSLKLETKLIAQAYDGAAVMRVSANGVQVQMKKLFPHAHYVHSYSHQLNIIIEKTISFNKRIKLFFSSLNGIGVFFTTSLKHKSQLQTFCTVQIPRVCETLWNFYTRLISAVRKNRKQIIQCFNSIQNEEGWDQKSIYESVGFTKTLEDEEFIFFLDFFFDIFKHLDILFGILQHRKPNSITSEEAFKNFEMSVIYLRENLKNLISDDSNHSKTVTENLTFQQRKRPKRETSYPFHSCLITYAEEMCNNLMDDLKTNFQTSDIFQSFTIVNPNNFKLHRNSFPAYYIKNISTNYSMLNENKLKSELSVLYANDTFANIANVGSLLKFINENRLDETFSEVTKLLEIVLVTPISTDDSERYFSTMNQIKTFLRNTMSEDRLNSLACLSIHKEYISEIKDFNNKVINTFAQMKNRRAYYFYK